MNRKLLVLNLVLIAAAAVAGVELRKSWMAAKAKEKATLNRPVKPVSLPPLQPLREPPPVVPSNYIDVAQKMLFDPSRNPNVPVEPPPPPPPPPPMPPLPVFHGMMNFGGGPIVILSVGSNGPHQAIHPGEPIGQFTFVSVTKDGLTFEWNGEKVFRSADELADHGQAAAPVQAADAAPSQRTAAPSAPPAAPAQPALVGPGQDTAFGWKTCNLNDGLEAGTVKDGYRKVITTTPFGKTCTWDPVK